MYKVLLVDDEPAIRTGLVSLIDWTGLGYEVVDTAANGREALEKFDELHPQMMVVDIRMPGMDGLQLIQEIKKRNSNCHFLILSGYSDFNYARGAIGLGVDGYILKPVDEDEMSEELKRISGIMQRESEMEKRRKDSEDVYRERMLLTLIHEKGEPNYGPEINELFGTTHQGYQIILLELELQKDNISGSRAALRRSIEDMLQARKAGFTFLLDSRMGILLREGLANGRALIDFYRQLRAIAENGTRFFAAGGASVPDIRRIHDSYEEAAHVLQNRFLLEGETIHLYSSLQELSSHAEEPLTESALQQMADKLLFALELGQPDKVQHTVKEAGQKIRSVESSAMTIKTSMTQVLTLALNKLAALNPAYAAPVKESMNHIPVLFTQSTYHDLIQEAAELTVQLANRIGNMSSAPIIKQITAFIELHYGENLKLETLAELHNYNSGYLGKLFKSETGESFNTYLDRVRIRHAIELLGSGLKVHQVARLVGYANVDYFHSKFKKYVGESPSTFKGKSVKLLREDPNDES
ncbi:response regulator transcription factor [Gorillibacterium timonense]|uniref:response regulator transcription factor n=1 Tax=Gorillibacterium timonense TaxID=1689269 RepID=UPI00071CCB37|nr:response regulator transcription factor [Gorillibacterium timonense]